MHVEIIRDPRETLQASGIVLSDRHHLLGTYPWLEWCQKQVPEARLFVYHHARSDRFELCNWLYSPSESTEPLFMEIEGFQGDPRHLWPQDLLPPIPMQCRLRPIQEHVERQVRMAQDAESARTRERDITGWARKDRAKYLHTKNLHMEAEALAAGHGHYTPPELMGDRHAELMEEFSTGKTSYFV